MKIYIIILLMIVGLAAGDGTFKIIWKQDIVTRPPAEFVRYYASSVWLKYQGLNGFAKISRIWPGIDSPLAEAATVCEQLMCED